MASEVLWSSNKLLPVILDLTLAPSKMNMVSPNLGSNWKKKVSFSHLTIHIFIYIRHKIQFVFIEVRVHLLRCGETAEESLFRNKIHFYSKKINKSHFFSSNKFFFRPTFNILVVISAICSNEKRGFCQ